MQNGRPEEVYFLSWLNHNWDMLAKATNNELQYDRVSKRPICGHKELKEYWERNAERQEQLTVKYSCIQNGEKWSVYTFFSRFFHTKKKKWHSVFGTINFYLDEGGKIDRISENYTKLIDDEHAPIIIDRYRFFKKLRSLMSMKTMSLFLKRMVRICLFAVTLFMVIAASIYLLLTIFSMGDFIAQLTLLEFWENDIIEPNILEARKQVLISGLGGLMAVSTVIFILVQKWSEQLSVRKSIKIHKIQDTKHDPANIMAKYLNGANNATIFAGNFDFFEKEEQLVKVLYSLQKRNDIVSGKT